MMEWFVGVVEDRNDPEMMGRVRVRIVGAHSPNVSEVPTGSLPWATVMTPTSSPSISGVGESPSIVEGSWVVGFFHDDQLKQDPIIMGTIPGKPTEKRSSDVGFSDPNQVYPKYLDESDIPARAREIQGSPYTGTTRLTEPDESWDGYGAEYPHNQVKATEAGHYKEYDDTEGFARIKEFHKSGTFYEVQDDGTIVTHVVKDNYRVVLRDENVYVEGNVNLQIAGNCNTQIDGNWDVDVTGIATIDAAQIFLNRDNGDAWAAARLGDTADTGDAGTGSHFDTNSAGTDKIETGSGTVFIGK